MKKNQWNDENEQVFHSDTIYLLKSRLNRNNFYLVGINSNFCSRPEILHCRIEIDNFSKKLKNDLKDNNVITQKYLKE